jgi:hypothetical protein
MSQHDFDVANQGAPAFRADVNAALQALVSNSSGATAPASPQTHQFFLDTSGTPWILKIYDGADWIGLGTIDATTNAFVPYRSGVALGDAAIKTAGTATGNVPLLATIGDSKVGLPAKSSTFAIGPCCWVALSGATNLTGASAAKIGNLDSEQEDFAACWDSTNKRFQPQIAGYYVLTGAFSVSTSIADQARLFASIYQGGAEVSRGPLVATSGANNDYSAMVTTPPLEFNGSSDFAELYGYISAAGTYALNGNAHLTYLGAHRVG